MNYTFSRTKTVLWLTALLVPVSGFQGQQEHLVPPQVRAQNFTVTPSTGPVTNIIVNNPNDRVFTASMTVEFPQGWRVEPDNMDIRLGGGESKAFAFVIKKAADNVSNRYEVKIRIEGSGVRLEEEQEVVCATTPYYKPHIDGDLEEWKDAVPISFVTKGNFTKVMSCWNRRKYCLALEVEEEDLEETDAIQFSLSPLDSVTGSDSSETSQRYEFLIKDASCLTLIRPGQLLSVAASEQQLSGLETEGAEVSVRRSGKITRYEISLPTKSLSPIKPMPGREYCFSLLAHDPDGAGMRDLGSMMNLWDEYRGNKYSWCLWEGARWGKTRPFDNKVEFGFSSSIH
jgi:hypothetical protein